MSKLEPNTCLHKSWLTTSQAGEFLFNDLNITKSQLSGLISSLVRGGMLDACKGEINQWLITRSSVAKLKDFLETIKINKGLK